MTRFPFKVVRVKGERKESRKRYKLGYNRGYLAGYRAGCKRGIEVGKQEGLHFEDIIVPQVRDDEGKKKAGSFADFIRESIESFNR